MVLKTKDSKTSNMSKDRSIKSPKVLSIAFISILLVGYGVSATTPDVSIGSNGIEINTGGLDMGGGDITDGGTTIYDAASGEIPDAVLGIDLSTNAGNDLTWDSNNNEFDVDTSNIQSGTTASDVGLGNVENEAAVAEGGDTMTGDLNMDSRQIIFTDAVSPNIEHSGSDDLEIASTDNGIRLRGYEGQSNSAEISIRNGDYNGGNAIKLDGDASTSNECIIDDGTLTCENKNWVHDLGNGFEAVYSSQESPEVRAVYEGKISKERMEDNYEKVELPEHFSITVSDTEPMLRVQATPHELATVAVTERTDDHIVIESSKATTVDYRITGIREGYEDKQVVREKEE